MLPAGSGPCTIDGTIATYRNSEAAVPGTPLLLYTFSAGRFGNQLLRFFHWTAWVRELEGSCSVMHLPFWPYAKLFREWRESPACVSPRGGGWVNAVARMAGRWPWGGEWDTNWKLQRALLRASRHMGLLGVELLEKPVAGVVNLEDPAFVERARAARYLVCGGWEYSCWGWLERHAGEVRGCFTPVPEYGDVASAFIADLRGRNDVLVGLFVRRGDYETFFDGRFYYSWCEYARWVGEVVAHYPGKRVVVVAAGDERFPREVFDGLPVVLATGSINSGGHWLESFLELALCDILLGPPSTFVACAAFYGDKPWWPLRSAGQSLRAEQILVRHIFEAACDAELALAVR